MQVRFEAHSPFSGYIVVGMGQNKEMCPFTRDLDKSVGHFISHSLEHKNFSGKLGECCKLVLPKGHSVQVVYILGLGDLAKLSPLHASQIGGHLGAHLKQINNDTVRVSLSQLTGTALSNEEASAHVAYGSLLRMWDFTKYKTKKDENQPPKKVEHLIMDVATPSISQAHFDRLKAVAEGVFLTRELVSEPSNVLYPETFVERAKALKSLGVTFDVLDETDMRKLGMHALLGVGQGSEKESKLLVLQWHGGAKDEPPIAIVGKGVTFDTGGISLKPSAGMDDMKTDMAGAAVVVGLLHALAARNAKVNVVGVAGLVENMPSGAAQRPGDIVKSMSGQTIEVLDTDAEGRLVLADALWYTQHRFKPKLMVDLATLTGAILIALGDEMAGLFSNNDELAQRLTDAGTSVDELLWRLPLSDAYDKDIDSTIADVKNLGAPRLAGSTAAAQFLQRFVNHVPWAHLDIAGTKSARKDKPLAAKGPTGFGVRLLHQMIWDHYEVH